MKYTYKPTGVCSTEMIFDIDEDKQILNDIEVIGGCPGNLLGIKSLIKGMLIDDIILKLSDIKCGFRQTSCPDQIAKFLKEYSKKN